jgi:hypothetical protein
MSGFDLQRLGQIMEPEPGNPMEAEGVLNPAAVRGPDGELYLFPRLVAQGNYSRIDVYYGMADNRIGVAWLDVPEHLPPDARADGDGPKTEA